ncbi:MAG: DUF1868 domain-containing protein [Brevinema sp.]
MEQYLDCVNGEFRKFNPIGEPTFFPGNTFLCHVPKNNFWRFCRYVQSQTDNTDFSHKFAPLPASSFHMTVCEGVCDKVRRKDNWVDSISLDASLYEVTQYIFSHLELFPTTTQIRMAVKKIALKGGIFFIVEPANKVTEEYLRDFRSFIFNKLKINNLYSNGYEFHISLAYNLISLTAQEQTDLEDIFTKINNILDERNYIIEFGAVEFCYFNDMFHFATLAKIEMKQ